MFHCHCLENVHKVSVVFVLVFRCRIFWLYRVITKKWEFFEALLLVNYEAHLQSWDIFTLPIHVILLPLKIRRLYWHSEPWQARKEALGKKLFGSFYAKNWNMGSFSRLNISRRWACSPKPCKVLSWSVTKDVQCKKNSVSGRPPKKMRKTKIPLPWTEKHAKKQPKL